MTRMTTMRNRLRRTTIVQSCWLAAVLVTTWVTLLPAPPPPPSPMPLSGTDYLFGGLLALGAGYLLRKKRKK